MSFVPRVTTVPDLDTLIDGIAAFAVSDGGYTQLTTVDGVRILSKGGLYYCLRSHSFTWTDNTVYAIDFRMTYAIPTDSITFYTVAGALRTSRMAAWNIAGPYTSYYLFQHDGCIHAALEVLPGVFTHMSFGQLVKAGTYTGGEYTSGQAIYFKFPAGGNVEAEYISNSYYFGGDYGDLSSSFTRPNYGNGYVRVKGDSNNALDFAINRDDLYNNTKFASVVGQDSIIDILTQYYGSNTFNMRSPLFPIYCMAWDNVASAHRYLGHVPGITYLNGSRIDIAEIVDNDWQVFPYTAYSTSDLTSYPAFPYRSIAYLRA